MTRRFLRPPICFLIVFLMADFAACLGDFFLETTSTNSGKVFAIKSLPIDLTASSRNFFANGNATRPTPAAKDPMPLPR